MRQSGIILIWRAAPEQVDDYSRYFCSDILPIDSAGIGAYSLAFLQVSIALSFFPNFKKDIA